MKKMPSPITKDNFSDAYGYIAKLYKKNQKFAVMRKIIIPLGSILFILLSVFMTIALIYANRDAEDMLVFEKLPFLISPLEKFLELIGKLPEMWYVRVPVCVLSVFVVPFIIDGIVSILPAVLVGGKKIEDEPVGTELEKAKALHKIACATPGTRYGNEDSHNAGAVLIAIGYIVLMMAFLVFSMITIGFFNEGDVKTMVMTGVGVVIAAVIAYFILFIVSKIFLDINGVFYSGEKATWSIIKETDAYWVENDPEEKKKREEEERKAAAARAAQKAKDVAEGKACYKCGQSLGASGGYEVSGKKYCWECSKSVPRTYADYECHHCAYYYVDSNYDGYCSLDDTYKDRNKTACSKFTKG